MSYILSLKGLNMIKGFFSCVLPLLLFVVSSCSGRDIFSGDVRKAAHFCYIPFTAETYSGTSRDDIMLKCADLGVVSFVSPFVAKFMSIIGRASAIKRFDDRSVRLRVAMPDGTVIFVNQEGEVAIGERYLKISPSDMDYIDVSLEQLRVQSRKSRLIGKQQVKSNDRPQSQPFGSLR